MYGELATLGSPEAQKWVLAKNATLKYSQVTAPINSLPGVKKPRLCLGLVAWTNGVQYNDSWHCQWQAVITDGNDGHRPEADLGCVNYKP